MAFILVADHLFEYMLRPVLDSLHATSASTEVGTLS